MASGYSFVMQNNQFYPLHRYKFPRNKIIAKPKHETSKKGENNRGKNKEEGRLRRVPF